MKILTLAFTTILIFCVECFSTELTGKVRSQSGDPLPDVFIFYGRSMRDITQTDKNGHFSLPIHNKVIFFRCVGYQPLTKIVDNSAATLDVTLNDAKTNEITPPACSTVKVSGKRIGHGLMLLPPKGSESHQGFDVDYGYFSISDASGKDRVWLEGIYGPMATLGMPPEEWILNAKEFTERSYRGMGLLADMRGKANDGTYWRYIGALGTSIKYSGLTEEAAKYFDKIIDDACVSK